MFFLDFVQEFRPPFQHAPPGFKSTTSRWGSSYSLSIEAHHFFLTFLKFGSSRPLPQTEFGAKINLLYRGRKIPWPINRYTTRIMENKWPIIYFFSDDVWAKEPRHSEKHFRQKSVYLYRSPRPLSYPGMYLPVAPVAYQVIL